MLVLVDYFSRFCKVEMMWSTTSEKIIECLEETFTTHCLPLSVISDNGPQFRSDVFERYVEDCGVEHRKATLLWPQANGEVDRQNRSLLKRMRIAQAERKEWKKELRKYLVAYRSSCHTTTGVSPAELLFGKKMRIKSPELREEVIATGMRDRDSGKKTKVKTYTDNKRNTKPLDVSPGDKLLVKQERQNKLSTPCAPEPHEVVTKTGNSVIIESTTAEHHPCKEVRRITIGEGREEPTTC